MKSFFTINYETALGNKKKINLDQIANSISYIPLQTDSNCLLARHFGIHFTPDYIFAENKDHVLMFDSRGKFIRKIGSPTNFSDDTIDFVKNPFKWENHTGMYMMITFDDFQPFYTFRDRYYFKSIHNDTVYTISQGKIQPAYFIDMGKYLLPIEKRPENPASKAAFELASDKCFYASPIETEGTIFITTNNYKNDFQQNILYNKRSGEGTFLVKDQNAASGFINNIDNGPEFWPEGYIDENSVYMSVSPAKILELVESDEFKNVPGNDAARKKFVDMANKLKEEDNPVLMTVTLK